MEIYTIKNLNFTYPNRDAKSLKNINLSINEGEFVLLCGESGCGKTTLLKILKSTLSPHGEMSGEIKYKNLQLEEIELRKQATEIGFVFQNPENQIATDKVWHELAFGLENLGLKTPEIRTKVSEMASFFGIQNWFYYNTSDLSGGQKQILNLASIMVMQPEVLILDEPTSQLDPIAASEFIKTLKKINDEFGTTIIISEHRLEEVYAISDRVIVLDSGEIIADDTPENVGRKLNEINHHMFDALPVPMRVFGKLDDCTSYPLTIREGKNRLFEYCKTHSIDENLIPKDEENKKNIPIIEVKDAYFRYEKNLPDVIKGLNMTVYEGEIFAVLGGNGMGKTTALSLISGFNVPQKGTIKINDCSISEIDNLYDGLLGIMPQNPQSLFCKKTVLDDLMDMTNKTLSKELRENQIAEITALCRIRELLNYHPYDLSGGEQQRVALAMILIRRPQIIVLDEPTKGMDDHFKKLFAEILTNLKMNGVTILIVSHDIEFCAEYADRCALFFDGNITSIGTPRQFFSGNSFYTTSANRMARKLIPNVILANDILISLGKKINSEPRKINNEYLPFERKKEEKKKDRLSIKRILLGIVFLLCTAALYFFKLSNIVFFNGNDYLRKILIIIFAALGLGCLIPQKKNELTEKIINKDAKRKKSTIIIILLILIAIPLTILFGKYCLGDKKYYLISFIIIFETMMPFYFLFEKRKPKAREIVLISALCAIAVAGRTAFFMLPEFKPVVALVIISGICFGGETGFLVGSITGFVSNFFFGQGPWTPWQMFALGIIGFLAGLIYQKGLLKKNKVRLSIFGLIVTIVIYGGIMNTSSVFMMTNVPKPEMLISSYVMGFPFDIIHALSTVFFLWFISEPMIEKLERIKMKYGVVER